MRRCCNCFLLQSRVSSFEPSDLRGSWVYPGFSSAPGIQFKTLSGPSTAGFSAPDIPFPVHHQLPLWSQSCAIPTPHRTTAVPIFHVSLITQFYDYDNVLQIATRQLIQWTWISGQLAVVLESFNHHVISHLFNTDTHAHTNVICGLSFVHKFSICSAHKCNVSAFTLGCLAATQPCFCWGSHDLH